MTTNSSFISTRVANYKLSSSYPSITPLYSKDLNYNGSLSFTSYTKSWSSYQNMALKATDNLRNQDLTNNSDLQPLNWLQKESIIDIDPLDIEDELKDDSNTPGYDDLIDPHISHAKVEVESQENSNIHDFVRFQAMRNSMNNSNRVALRNNNSFTDCNQNYSHQASGFAKPNLSYTQLIFMAIETCKDRAMTVNDIYQWCEVNYPYYKHIGPSWKNSLRHNLSINKSFRRMPRDGQTTIGNYEMNSGDDMSEETVSQRDNKQGGPGRGAYWVVDDKERKNLLDSIYRAHQTIPLSDRNGQRIDPPYSLIVNPPKTGPMLRIDGRFTDASTYLQSKRSDDEVANENYNIQSDYANAENLSMQKIENTEAAEYTSMMFNLATTSSPETGGGDTSVKLSASYNSNCSRMEGKWDAHSMPSNDIYSHLEADSDLCQPKLKNRRKSKHEKVRNYSEMESATKDLFPNRKNQKSDLIKTNNGMTSVNVIVAPHFDHIYARYQQFLPPAIASDMDKGVFGQEHDINPDADFLKNGYRDDDDEDNENEGEQGEIENEDEQSNLNSLEAIKQEKLETDTAMLATKLNGSRRIKLCWNGKLNSAAVAFTRQRKVRRVLNRRARRSLRIRKPREPIEPNETAIKKEMIEPNEQTVIEDASDGYATDSTMPMSNRKSITRTNRIVANKTHPVRILPVKRKASLSKSGPPEKRYRSKRKRTRPLRIDESKEIAAIQFLASLEKRQQNIQNLENLYNFNNYLQTTLSAGESSCNSSVVMVQE